MKKTFFTLTLSLITSQAFAQYWILDQATDKFGIMNDKRQFVIPCIYDHIELLDEGGLFRVKLNEQYGLVDTLGQIIVPVGKYDIIKDFSEGFSTVNLHQKSTVINTKGDELIPIETYDYITVFSYGLARVSLNGKDGCINYNGKLVIPCLYQSIMQHENGTTIVSVDAKFGLIDKTGKVLVEMGEYLSIVSCGDGMFRAYAKKGITYLNEKGEAIIPLEKYTEQSDSKEGFAAVKRDDKQGFIDKTGKEIVPCEYDEIFPFEHGEAPAIRNGKRGKVNTKGDWIEDEDQEEKVYYEGIEI